MANLIYNKKYSCQKVRFEDEKSPGNKVGKASLRCHRYTYPYTYLYLK